MYITETSTKAQLNKDPFQCLIFEDIVLATIVINQMLIAILLNNLQEMQVQYINVVDAKKQVTEVVSTYSSSKWIFTHHFCTPTAQSQ